MQQNLPLVILVVVAVVALLAVAAFSVLRRRRRKEEAQRPFPPEWREMLERELPLYARMPQELRLRLEPVVRSFLASVEFVGCQGLQVTEKMRLLIAVQACLLIVEHDSHAYASLYSVLVYPDEFVVDEAEEDDVGVVTEGTRVLTGQTVDTARIILSWRDVIEGSPDGDAYNVVLHEFAHYLDHSSGGRLSETPLQREARQAWHDIMEREYDSLCDAVDRGEPTLIDPYGAEHPAEFFAVATETFFEQSAQMEQAHPHLYGELRRFYGLDPARWS